jgi:type IV pilus assembly protein PilZ
MSMKSPRQGVMSLALRDKKSLHKAYMPFLAQGGLFIPTDKHYEIGDEVFLLLTLMDETQRLPVTGRVVWITPKGALGNRLSGIGIRFEGAETAPVHKKIETYLAGYSNIEHPTHTM